MITKIGCFIVLTLFLCKVGGQLHIECLTPNNENATCESIYNCKAFLSVLNNLTASQKKFMQDSLCGYYNRLPVVCCGTKTDYTGTSRPKREVTEDSCGKSVKDTNKESNTALKGQFPWSARLSYNKTSKFSCEGSLISSRYVLTSGLCIEEAIIKRMGPITFVRLGQYNCLESDQNCKSDYQDIAIEKVITNENYGHTNNINHDDIGLIKLAKEVTFSDTITPVCLPKPTDSPLAVGELLIESGWYRNSKIQLKSYVPVASLEVCTNVYNQQGVPLTKSHLCAGGLNNTSCAGTAGGPLTKIRDDGKSYLEGIVSFGPIRCGLVGWPNVYTNVRLYLQWIHDNIKE